MQHNCMASPNRAVMVFVKEIQWIQRPWPLQNGKINHKPKKQFLRKNYATFFNQPWVSLMFKKKLPMKKTNKSELDFVVVDPCPRQPVAVGGKIVMIVNVRPWPPKLSNTQFTKSFFLLQNSWSCPQAYHSGGCRRILLLDGAVNFLTKICHHITTVKLLLASILVFIRKPRGVYKHFQNRPKHNKVNFKHLGWCLL